MSTAHDTKHGRWRTSMCLPLGGTRRRWHTGLEEWDRGFSAAGTDTMKRAADAGLARAHVLIGDSYANGEHGFERSLSQAVPWYRLAAKKGDGTALAKLGACAFNGTGGVAQDYAEAAALYVQAASAGNAQAILSRGNVLKGPRRGAGHGQVLRSSESCGGRGTQRRQGDA